MSHERKTFKIVYKDEKERKKEREAYFVTSRISEKASKRQICATTVS